MNRPPDDAKRDTASAIKVLRQQFGARLSVNETVRAQHGHTTTWLTNQPPEAVIAVRSSDEVAQIVRVCRSYRAPVIAFGVGSSLEGQLNAPYGGICIDLSTMNTIIATHVEDLDCTVQAGVTRRQLNEALRDRGVFFPIDPGADATIGGMAATRASGTNAVRYGTMKDNVLHVSAVLADGRVIRTASRAKKTAAGYDLTRLLVGSEGTLGILTEVGLRLHAIPERISAGVCHFPSVRDACNTVIMCIQMGIPVARIELLDALSIKAVNAYSNLTLAPAPTLFVEFHTSEAGAAEPIEAFGEIVASHGGGPFEWAARREERNRLWRARHDVYWAGRALAPHLDVLATDVCVPISRLADCIDETRRDIERFGLIAPILGHVGDGNFHTAPLFDKRDARACRKIETFLHRLSARAIAMQGTCTGEHGIGQGKMAALESELGPALDAMRAIKRALDPDDIMNPGKIFSP